MLSPEAYQGLETIGYSIVEKFEKTKQQYREYQALKRARHVFALSTPASRQSGNLVIREAEKIDRAYILRDDFELGDTDEIDSLGAMMSQLVAMKEKKHGHPLIELEHTAIIATPYRFLPRNQAPIPLLTLRFRRPLPETERNKLIDDNVEDIDGWIPRDSDYYHAVETTKQYSFHVPILNSLGYTLDIIPEFQLASFQPNLSLPR
jgi:hypothetical protein